MIAYLVVTGVILLLRGEAAGGVELSVHFGLLALVVACAFWRRAPGWARDWVGVVAVPVMYSELPAVIGNPGPSAMFDATVLRWEVALFGGQPAQSLAERFPSVWLSEPLHAAYVSYYAIVALVPVLVYAFRRREQFHEAVFVLLFTFAVCFLGFVVFPVQGPRYSGTSYAPGGPIRAFALWVLDHGSSRGTAFPSSHVAVTTAQCVLAVRYFGARGALLIPLGVGLALGAVYGGFHYGVDALAGAGAGALLAAAGLRLASTAGRAAPAQANATAPM